MDCVDLTTPPGSPAGGAHELLEAGLAPGIIDGGALEHISNRNCLGKKRAKKPPPEPKEDTIAMKIAAIREVGQAYDMSYLEDGGFQLSKANRFLSVPVRCLGKVKRMDAVSLWAVRMKQEQWLKMGQDKAIIAKYRTELVDYLKRGQS